MCIDYVPSKRHNILFSFIHALLILCVQMFGINVNLVISVDGALVGFFVVYFFPIALHMKNQFK